MANIPNPGQELVLSQTEEELANELKENFVNYASAALNRLYTKNKTIEIVYQFPENAPVKVVKCAIFLAQADFTNSGWVFRFWLYGEYGKNRYKFKLQSRQDYESNLAKEADWQAKCAQKKARIARVTWTILGVILLAGLLFKVF